MVSSATVGEAEVCLLEQDLPVLLPLDPQRDLERYQARVTEVARAMEGDLEVAEVALQVARAHYQVLIGAWDVLHHYQNDCSMFLEWQTAWGMPVDLGESRDVGLPLDNNDLPLT